MCLISPSVRVIYKHEIVCEKRRTKMLNYRLYTVLLRINAGGIHLIFDIFSGAFIQGRRLHEGGVYYKIQKKFQFYISTSMISSFSSIRKTALSASSTSESVIRSNGLGRSGHFDKVHLPCNSESNHLPNH